MTRRLPAILVALTLAAGAVLAGPAPAAQAASCEADAGVTVVVDFASLGGGVGARCAAGDPSSGVAALTAAGYSPARAAQERSGYFLCRIDGKPASDPCQRAAGSSAYWSYWHAEPGGSWTFSNTGPGSFDPASGSVEGWAYGAGKPPSVAPPAAAQPPPAPPASPAPAPAPRVEVANSLAPAVEPRPARTAASRAASASPAVGPAAEPAATSAAPETTAPETTAPETIAQAATGAPTPPPGSASPEPTPTQTPEQPPEGLDAAPTTARDNSSPAGPLAAALLVLALLTAGGWQLAQRRREQL